MFQIQKPSPEVVVVDDFYADPDAVRAFALKQQFQKNRQIHKGQRSIERFYTPEHQKTFEQLLGVSIQGWEDQPHNGVFQFCISGDEIVFHSDLQRWAGVVYLTPDAPLGAGTTFYRSKVSGLRKEPTQADADRAGVSLELLTAQTYRGKLLRSDYWEPVDVVGNVYNRLVLWNAKLLHAASSYFGDSVLNARLFHMFFFD